MNTRNLVSLAGLVLTLGACATEATNVEDVEADERALSNDVVRTNPLPPGFDSRTAQAKQAELMRRIETSRYALARLDRDAPIRDLDLVRFGGALLDRALTGGNIHTKRLIRQTFDQVSDDMPIEHDTKFVHGVGSVASVELVPASSKYTGLFQGAKGLARFSLAIKPGSFTPGVGIKLFVDGKPSANVLAMQAVTGQGADTNFFANEFSNIIPIAPNGPLQLLEGIFKLATEKTNMLSVAPLGRVTLAGKAVDPSTAAAPCQIFLTPTPAVRTLISASSTNDFRVDLARVRPQTEIYEISGTDRCGDDRPEARLKIGTLRTTSEMIPSKYGDVALFFKHEEFR